MWKNTYKDYKLDEAWIKERVEPSQGITGCEMHERNGWGERHHIPTLKKRGLVRAFFKTLFKKKA